MTCGQGMPFFCTYLHWCLKSQPPPFLFLFPLNSLLHPQEMAAMASRAVGGTPLVVALSTTSASSLNSNQNIVAGIRTGSATSTATARKLSDFDGLKACHGLAPKAAASTEARFAAVVASIRGGRRRSGGGGALSASCDIGAEIIRVVPIMSALVLVGVAFGFVLLRIEASVEEAEE